MSFKYNFDSDKSHKLYKVLKPIAVMVSKKKYKINYIGEENIPKTGGFIIASNHITAFDPVMISAGSPVELHFMAKQELFENKIVGWFLSQLNAFPVDREKFDYRAINHSIKLIKDGGSLGIFPEGTRSEDFKPHKGKGGVCYIAKACKCDVVPVAIYTADEAKSGTKLTIRYGKPIKYEEFNFDENTAKMKDLRFGTRLIMERITELWEEGHAD